MNFLFFALTVGAAFAGGYLLNKLNIPSGALLGGIIAVAVLNITTGQAFFFDSLKVVLQILAGAMIGGKLGKEDVFALRATIKPAILLVLGMMVLNISFGGAVYMTSELDIPTALFATVPGGVTDMALISGDLGADPAIVAILQLCRILIVFTIFPPIFKKLILRMRSKSEVTTEQSSGLTEAVFDPKNFLLLLGCACVGGVIFWQLGVSAGALIGGMIGGAAFGISREKVAFPFWLRRIMQVMAGAFIGVKLDMESLRALPGLAVPILIMMAGSLIFVFAMSALMHKATGLSYDVCLLSSTPAGVQEMALLSEELGVETVKVSVLQTARLIFVIMFFPTMITVIHSLFA